MTTRRGFMGSILACATPPGFVRSGVLMPLLVPRFATGGFIDLPTWLDPDPWNAHERLLLDDMAQAITSSAEARRIAASMPLGPSGIRITLWGGGGGGGRS